MVANMHGFISGDCGVMHLAAASGTPTLGLFQSTMLANYAPYGGASSGIAAGGMSASSAAEMAARWFHAARAADGHHDGDRAAGLH